MHCQHLFLVTTVLGAKMPNVTSEFHFQKNAICFYLSHSIVVLKCNMYHYVVTFSILTLPHDLYRYESFALMCMWDFVPFCLLVQCILCEWKLRLFLILHYHIHWVCISVFETVFCYAAQLVWYSVGSPGLPICTIWLECTYVVYFLAHLY